MPGFSDIFQQTCPCIVGFISKIVRGRAGTAKPEFPTILGTGFVADSSGLVVTNRHVVECLETVRNHPRTGEPSIAAVLWFPSQVGPAHHGWQMVSVPILDWAAVQDFGSTEEWYGTDVPDVAIAQIGIRDIPSLLLAEGDYYVRVGMEIATLGYPMGDIPLSVTGHLNQMTPFIRHGIVSSVFPFPVPKPHGFTVDIMQQGGSSGSPILSGSSGAVIGIMRAGVIDWRPVQFGQHQLMIPLNTNISIAEPAHIIQQALDQFRKERRVAIENIPTLERYREMYPPPQDGQSDSLQWESWTNLTR